MPDGKTFKPHLCRLRVTRFVDSEAFLPSQKRLGMPHRRAAWGIRVRKKENHYIRGSNTEKLQYVLILCVVLPLFLWFVMLILKMQNQQKLEWYTGQYGEEPILFSCKTGFYESGVELELRTPGKLPEGAAIYYTLDGTDPAAGRANLYSGPIVLKAGKGSSDSSGGSQGREEIPNAWTGIFGGIEHAQDSPVYDMHFYTVRAKIIMGEKETRTQYGVYCVGPRTGSVKDELIVCVDADPEDLYDYEKGILVGGKILEENGNNKYHGNYMEKGSKWSRPCHVAIFDAGGSLLEERNAGASISGGMSRILDQKSFNLDAGGEYGDEDGRFLLDIFADSSEADCAHVGKSTHIRLRARSQTSRSFREKLVGQLGAQSGFRSVVEPVPCKVYLNGTFYMLAEMEQTFSNSWFSHRFDLPDTDHIEKYKGKEVSVFRKMKITDLFAADLTKEENRKALEAAVDMDDYLLYYAINILDNNLDWPRNNVQAWRYTGDYVEGRPYTDGRIRFTLYDSDKAFNPDPSLVEDFGTDTFVSMMENIKRGYESRFRDVMKADEYRNRMVTILCDLMNTSFETQHVLSLLEEDYALAREECSTCFTAQYMEQVEENAAMAAKAAAGYNDMIRKDLLDYFGLKQQYRMSLKAAQGVEVTWNNMLVSPDQEYDCSYYKGVPFSLTASALPGWKFDHWEINGQPVSGETILADAAIPTGETVIRAALQEAEEQSSTGKTVQTDEKTDVQTDEKTDVETDVQTDKKRDVKTRPSVENNKIETNVLTIDGSLLEDGTCTVRAVASKEQGECILIAEISASGSDDWIRLYNAGTTEANLGHYCLSDDPAEPTKFRLPKTILLPGESCRINGSKNESKKEESLCSCNFMLSKDETLLLTPDKETGLAPDAFCVPYMSRDCTYGRRNNGNVLCWFDHRQEAIPVLAGSR